MVAPGWCVEGFACASFWNGTIQVAPYEKVVAKNNK